MLSYAHFNKIRNAMREVHGADGFVDKLLTLTPAEVAEAAQTTPELASAFLLFTFASSATNPAAIVAKREEFGLPPVIDTWHKENPPTRELEFVDPVRTPSWVDEYNIVCLMADELPFKIASNSALVFLDFLARIGQGGLEDFNQGGLPADDSDPTFGILYDAFLYHLARKQPTWFANTVRLKLHQVLPEGVDGRSSSELREEQEAQERAAAAAKRKEAIAAKRVTLTKVLEALLPNAPVVFATVIEGIKPALLPEFASKEFEAAKSAYRANKDSAFVPTEEAVALVKAGQEALKALLKPFEGLSVDDIAGPLLEDLGLACAAELPALWLRRAPEGRLTFRRGIATLVDAPARADGPPRARDESAIRHAVVKLVAKYGSDKVFGLLEAWLSTPVARDVIKQEALGATEAPAQPE